MSEKHNKQNATHTLGKGLTLLFGAMVASTSFANHQIDPTQVGADNTFANTNGYIFYGNNNVDYGTRDTIFGNNNILASLLDEDKEAVQNLHILYENEIKELNAHYQADNKKTPSNEVFAIMKNYNGLIKPFADKAKDKIAENTKDPALIERNTLSSNIWEVDVRGNGNTLSTVRSNVLGDRNLVYGVYNQVTGNSNFVNGGRDLVHGINNILNGSENLAIGQNNRTNGDYVTALGRDNVATGNYTFVSGQNSEARTNYSIAMGKNAIAGETSPKVKGSGIGVAIGDNVNATGNQSLALGHYNTATTNEKTTAVGNGNTVKGVESGAFGTANIIDESSAHSYAVGRSNHISKTQTFVLGSDVIANQGGSVYLGAGVTTDRENTVTVGSVGHEKQIVNVKAGTLDTDVVNVGQMQSEIVKAVNNATTQQKTYIDGENAKQDENINRNALAITALELKDVALDEKISNLNKLQAGKADKSYVDDKIAKTDEKITAITQKNTEQDTTIANNKNLINETNDKVQENVTAIANNKTAIDESKAQIQLNKTGMANNKALIDTQKTVFETAHKALSDLVNANKTAQDSVNDEQAKINANNLKEFERIDLVNLGQQTAISNLGNRIDNLDKDLSGGIAGVTAFASMPTVSDPNARMLSFGTGFYNGQKAIAIGYTGADSTGKLSFKTGLSYNNKSGTTIGAGVGYRFR